MPLPDNVKSIAGRGPGTRRPRPSPPPATRSTPFDSLLGLAIEIEQREPPAPTRHLAPAPERSVLPTPPGAPETTTFLPDTDPATVTITPPTRTSENFLIVVACVLVALIAALLLWGNQLERLLRPDLDSDDPAVEQSFDGIPSADDVPSESDAAAPAEDAPTTSSPVTTQASPPAGDPAPPAQPASPAVAPPVTAACDAASIWPLVAPLNDIAPVRVAWMTCLDQYATAGLVPADSPPETPATFVAALRSDGGTWALLSGGEPAACPAAAPAADPAFPPTLCG